MISVWKTKVCFFKQSLFVFLKIKLKTDNCLLLEKDNILNLLEDKVCAKKIGIYWWIKMRV